jgi:hypothetical protein
LEKIGKAPEDEQEFKNMLIEIWFILINSILNITKFKMVNSKFPKGLNFTLDQVMKSKYSFNTINR